ncbi:hypothetical protein MKW94_005212 [Papaver nudicaule]|uniref:Uncharacterized protein n=1 Tax=Papaver nudicaule TaxID=74823 RepID=A0AA41VDI3_PAPNU|nr:hypothetical protein [Papaver nudicaule]
MGETPSEMISNLNLDQDDMYMELEKPYLQKNKNILLEKHQEQNLQIFIIPTYIKERNPSAYEPKMVSIGPYHYGKTHLMTMQSHKKRALLHFLRRSRTRATEQGYVARLMLVVDQLRKSYEQVEQMERWKNDDDGFVKLMMVDGIFLLEFLSVLKGNQDNRDYANIDPIFGHRGHNLNYNYVMQDLLLLENQLPYLVLSTLLSVSEGQPEENTNRILSTIMFAPPRFQGHHLLDTYMKGILGGGSHHQRSDEERTIRISASKLLKYGVQFRTVGSYNKIRFDKHTATLSLPSIIINQHTVPRFFNSKVYELRVGTNKDLNSYIHLMDSLIQSTSDVYSLRSQGIIVSSLGSDEAVVEVMKELTKDTVRGEVDDISIRAIEEVSEYYHREKKATRNWIWVRDNWASIVGAATMLLLLSVVQTVYTVLAFHYNKK